MRRLLVALVMLSLATVGLAAPASARSGVRAEGSFTVTVDFGSLRLSDATGGRCRLEVNGTLLFTGTLEGEAVGTTTALVFAPCSAVQVTPPGTYFDLFRFAGELDGAIDGSPVIANLTYAGLTRPGGGIDAAVLLHGDALGVLSVKAVVAEGGTYAGVVST